MSSSSTSPAQLPPPENIEYGLKYDLLRLTRKKNEPTGYEILDTLVDFGLPKPEDLTISKLFSDLQTWLGTISSDKIPEDWFNALAKKFQSSEKTLLFVLDIKMTILNSKSTFLKDWGANVSSGDTGDVKALESLYEKPSVNGATKTIFGDNKDTITSVIGGLQGDSKQYAKELLINIALGNVGDQQYFRLPRSDV